MRLCPESQCRSASAARKALHCAPSPDWKTLPRCQLSPSPGSLKPVSRPAGWGCAFSCPPPSHQRQLFPRCPVPKPQRVLAHRPETINGSVATNMNATRVATPSLHFQESVTNVAGAPVSPSKCQRQRVHKGPTVTGKSAAAGDFQLSETCDVCRGTAATSHLPVPREAPEGARNWCRRWLNSPR